MLFLFFDTNGYILGFCSSLAFVCILQVNVLLIYYIFVLRSHYYIECFHIDKKSVIGQVQLTSYELIYSWFFY